MSKLFDQTIRATKNVYLPSYPAPAVIAVERSDNRKLSSDRSVSATWVSQASCPSDCPLRNNGCYSENHLAGKTTRRLNQSTETDPTTLSLMEAQAIDGLSGKYPLRLHVVGDATTDEGAQALAAASARYTSRHGKRVWGYTHGWKTVKAESWGDISILASCQSPLQAHQALDAGYAPAMVVPKFARDKNDNIQRTTPIGMGLRGVPCPKQTGRKDSCKDCQLCWNANGLREKKMVILFETHGARWKAANKALAEFFDS